MKIPTKALFFLATLFLLSACGDDDANNDAIVDDYDRQAMLASWADQIIIPATVAFGETTDALRIAGETFEQSPSMENLTALRDAWWAAYMSWQRVSMFEIGKAEEIQRRDYLNIYPSNTEGIIENINNGGYNLELPSQRDRQGFPALDFLLYGIADGDEALLDMFINGSRAAEYRAYVMELTARIDELNDVVIASWASGYRDEFVSNSGNTATSSVNRLVNDYIFYYEKALRAGKIGIPAGVFSGTPLSSHVETLYRGEGAKELFLEALDAAKAFFNGQSFEGSAKSQGLDAYLDYLEASKDNQPLKSLINAQFDAAVEEGNKLGDNFSLQVQNDNQSMLQTYDALQKNVVLLKVDMLQAIDINVDYVDADGD